MTKPFWCQVNEQRLAQGDLLKQCLVPEFSPDYGTTTDPVTVGEYDLIIVTQSCDLENKKASLVALCPIWTLPEFEDSSPDYKKRNQWENVRKGRVEGLHLLGSPSYPDENRDALVVDFGQIFSLPIAYLEKKSVDIGTRWRLDSPFLEHFSQAFARYFMRVGLPSTIPPFK